MDVDAAAQHALGAWMAARLAGVSDPTRSLMWLLVAVGSVCLVNWVMQLMPG